jgi:hypothetical protein
MMGGASISCSRTAPVNGFTLDKRGCAVLSERKALSLAFEEFCDPASLLLSGICRYVDGIAASCRTIVYVLAQSP